jgi:hypothetical protein
MNHERVHHEWTKFGTFRTCPMCPGGLLHDKAEDNVQEPLYEFTMRKLNHGGRSWDRSVNHV